MNCQLAIDTILTEILRLQVEISVVQREVDKVSLGATLCEAGDNVDDMRILITDPSDLSVLSGAYLTMHHQFILHM